MNASPLAGQDGLMKTCDTCGNSYDKTFTVTRGEVSGTFDSFECAVQAMAPECDNCGCRILGHGVESEGQMYCCAHCAREEGEYELVDRA
ncbi:MAG: hypothetical protein ACNYNX_07400 [Leucobacter sp.]